MKIHSPMLLLPKNTQSLSLGEAQIKMEEGERVSYRRTPEDVERGSFESKELVAVSLVGIA